MPQDPALSLRQHLHKAAGALHVSTSQCCATKGCVVILGASHDHGCTNKFTRLFATLSERSDKGDGLRVLGILCWREQSMKSGATVRYVHKVTLAKNVFDSAKVNPVIHVSLTQGH